MPSLPPPHPSLPLPPQPAVSSSPQVYTSYYNSHYLQAYSGPSPLHSASSNTYIQPPNVTTPRFFWYEPGNNRCSHLGCAFTGSKKTVELHMMDRHLIYPPGWKKKSEWDADPSLKGKPIPIQGTNVILDSPEVVEAWIAERKRRFPTAARVEDKKRKLEEAVARGQLDITQNSRPSKRRNVETSDAFHRDHRRNNNLSNKFQRAGNGACNKQSQLQRVSDSGWPKRIQSTSQIPEVKKVVAIVPSAQSALELSGSEDEDDGEPEIVSSKVTLQIPQSEEVQDLVGRASIPQFASRNCPQKKAPLQPKLPPRNPFGSRPTLLRNLLLPEIRITISNLSQAIHFLVENDFLRDVELKPGQAAESNRIQVVGSETDTREDISKPIS